ncbi:putative 5'(3')-deoxyribonucleotidase [Brevundimonas phage vB_BpoS-Marchewka]|uniref:5'(3')-deoxyribonucleotidase n=1 Tax=Brevundimonas phage vB_BpoS-Marchewka TaxID=2948604 RepID=A0A9E7N4P5_9CAUD|nr:putative 5'(3')-deoxyribonucleotidase [Brevundimonas phage vB_BpoS-Marchewka]UTC29316.1 putative 5'(3')-deoxyribonucleotidase [Brevundimonas phage vB_BpoS-Bambus]
MEFVVSLDLDGVEADYAAGMVALGYDVDPALGRDLNRSGTSHPLKREMYERIKGTEFYRHLPLQEGAVALYRAAARLMAGSARLPVIVTAAPKFGATEDDYYLNPFWLGAAYHKRVWVETVLLPAVVREEYDDAMVFAQVKERIAIPDENFICTTSARKFEFMHRLHGAHQILVDDRIANVLAWAEAGGIGVFHRSSPESIAALEAIGAAGGPPDSFQRVGKGYLYTGEQ